MQGDKKEKPKDEKKKKNKYIVKDGDGNIMDVEVPESWIKILEAMNKGEKKNLIPLHKNYGSNIEYNPKFLGKIKKGTGISVPISFFLFPLAQAILMIAFHFRLSRGCLFIIYFRYRGDVILFNTDRYLLNNDKKRVK